MSTDAVIHLIDDDEGVRRALAFLLSTAGLAVRVYDSADAFLANAKTLQPGCVLSDVRMPGADGLELLRRLTSMQIKMPVIVMTGHADVRLAVQAMKAGAIDFVEKPFDDELLLSTIRAAIDKFNAEDRRQSETTKIEAKVATLTPRERQVLAGLILGHPNKTVAYDLHLSPRTVEVHRANVMIKMGAHSLSELVRMILQTNFPNDEQSPSDGRGSG